MESTTESSPGLKIGFDARSICGERTGVGTYAANLIQALLDAAPQVSPVLFSSEDLPPAPWLRNERLRIVRSGSRRNNLVWTNVSLRNAIVREPVHLFHSPGYTRPLSLKIPSVVTLHDVSYEAAPQWYPYKLSFFRRLWYRQSAVGADAILTDSEFSRREIIRVYGVSAEKVHMIYLGVDHGQFRRVEDPEAMNRVKDRYNLGGEFVLSVGDVHPRRNLGAVIEALNDVNLELIVIGRQLQLPAAWKRPNVRYLGYVPDEDLPLFYNAARALVYPSFYEGFGFPIVEAMACGCPVITSRGTACEETAGGAALLADPASVQSIAEAITAILSNSELAGQYRARGLQRAAEFDWHKTAKETLAVYSKLIRP